MALYLLYRRPAFFKFSSHFFSAFSFGACAKRKCEREKVWKKMRVCRGGRKGPFLKRAFLPPLQKIPPSSIPNTCGPCCGRLSGPRQFCSGCYCISRRRVSRADGSPHPVRPGLRPTRRGRGWPSSVCARQEGG